MTIEVTGLWLGQNAYKVTRLNTGQTVTHFFAGSREEMKDLVLLDEVAFKLREATAAEWGVLPEKVMPSRQEQHAFGTILKEITASKRHRRETGHGRYW